MSHPHNLHSVAYVLYGGPEHQHPARDLRPLDLESWPFFGSVIDYLDRQRASGPPEIPGNLALPFQMSSQLPGVDRGGMYGGFLGRSFDPVWTEFEGTPTRSIDRWLGNRSQSVDDPYAGITPQARLTLSEAARARPEVTLDRLDRRRTLLAQMEDSAAPPGSRPGPWEF